MGDRMKHTCWRGLFAIFAAVLGWCAIQGCAESKHDRAIVPPTEAFDGSPELTGLIEQLRQANADVKVTRNRPDCQAISVDLSLVRDVTPALRLVALLPNVERLSLQGADLTPESIALLRKFPSLRWLDLSNTNISDADLAALESTPRLEFLLLWSTAIGDDGLSHVAGLDNLQKLDLSASTITSDGLAQLANLSKLLELYVEVPGIRAENIGQLQTKLPHTLIVY